jgi:hypothetical protein
MGVRYGRETDPGQLNLSVCILQRGHWNTLAELPSSAHNGPSIASRADPKRSVPHTEDNLE